MYTEGAALQRFVPTTPVGEQIKKVAKDSVTHVRTRAREKRKSMGSMG